MWNGYRVIPVFWAWLTGIAAARLLALMLLLFSVLVLVPPLFAGSRDQVLWGSNAYNLAAVEAAWIFAEARASHPVDA